MSAQMPEVTELNQVSNSYVHVMKFYFKSISIYLTYASVALLIVDDLDTSQESIL